MSSALAQTVLAIAQEHAIGAKPRVIARGAGSMVYRIDDRVIKILVAGRGGYARQYENGKRAHAKHLGPAVIATGTSHGHAYLIEMLQPGVRLTAGNITKKQAALMGAFYKKLSNTERGDVLPTEKWLGRVSSYRELLEPQHIQTQSMPAEYQATIHRARQIEERLRNHVIEHLRYLTRQRVSMRHGDSNPKNFFAYKGRIQAIDWVDHRGPLCLDTSDFLCKAKLTQFAESAFLQALPVSLRKATVAWRPVRAYTAVWWHIDEAYRREVHGERTEKTTLANLKKARAILNRIDKSLTRGTPVHL
jgi:hypothetical protein